LDVVLLPPSQPVSSLKKLRCHIVLELALSCTADEGIGARNSISSTLKLIPKYANLDQMLPNFHRICTRSKQETTRNQANSSKSIQVTKTSAEKIISNSLTELKFKFLIQKLRTTATNCVRA
jgi:hypothetical protein